MFRNYLKTAIRGLKKNKGFTFINVFGLALGLAVCLLIVLYVTDELGYDRYNEKADRIYRVNNDIKFGGKEASYAVAPAPLAAEMLAAFPEVEKAVRFRVFGGARVKKGNQNIQEGAMIYSDPSVFSIFTLPMLSGDPTTALKDPHTVVINETTAKKYFNRTNVLGETLVLNDTINYKVTGVIKDIPKQSHFRFDFFLSMSSLKESFDDSWLSNNFQTYILLKKGASIKAVDAKFPQLVRKKLNSQLQEIIHINYADFEKSGNYVRFSSVPVTDIHLHQNTVAEFENNSDVQYVYIFSAIAVFILLIACVNFMNLSTARSANRAREVGVRKVLGSARKNLVFQFLTESVLLTLIATLIAIIGAWMLLPLFNQMSGKEISISMATVKWLLPSSAVIVVVVGCLAGSYPALFLSGFQPVSVLKGKISAGFKGGFLRSSLVVFQFVISIFLIIGTLVIYNQLKFIQHKDLGYNRRHVLVIQNTSALEKQAKLFKQEVKALPGVVNATLTGFTPTMMYRSNTTMFPTSTPDVKHGVQSQAWNVDEDYFSTLDMKLVKGRTFSKDMPTDSNAMVVNQAFIAHLEGRDPLNRNIFVPQDSKGTTLKGFHIIGVIKDFNFSSLRENITPVAFTLSEERGALNIRVNTTNTKQLIEQIESKWKQLAPQQPFSYSFMDEDFDGWYRAESRVGSISIAFTSLAIIIACLGLFGLAAYAAEQRTKEIGIRKVLGAEVSSIVAMLSKDFIKLVLLAIVIASPAAWYLMQHFFLQSFYYRQNIQWWVVIAAGGTAILIAFITISFQSIKAALINPVKSLRSE